MKKITFLLFIIPFLGWSAIASAETMPEVKVHTNQTQYHQGENIQVDVHLTYEGSIPMEIATPLLGDQNSLAIRDSQDRVLPWSRPPISQTPVRLKQGDSLTDTVSISTEGWDVKGKVSLKYVLLVSIESQDIPGAQDQGVVSSNVAGYINSDPVTVEILP